VNQCYHIFLAETELLSCHLLTSGHQQKNGMNSDPTVTEHFCQASCNANGILLIVQIHIQTMRQEYCASSRSGTIFMDQREIFHVEMLKTKVTS
jgi:hypothetical protein